MGESNKELSAPEILQKTDWPDTPSVNGFRASWREAMDKILKREKDQEKKASLDQSFQGFLIEYQATVGAAEERWPTQLATLRQSGLHPMREEQAHDAYLAQASQKFHLNKSMQLGRPEASKQDIEAWGKLSRELRDPWPDRIAGMFYDRDKAAEKDSIMAGLKPAGIIGGLVAAIGSMAFFQPQGLWATLAVLALGGIAGALGGNMLKGQFDGEEKTPAATPADAKSPKPDAPAQQVQPEKTTQQDMRRVMGAQTGFAPQTLSYQDVNAMPQNGFSPAGGTNALMQMAAQSNQTNMGPDGQGWAEGGAVFRRMQAQQQAAQQATWQQQQPPAQPQQRNEQQGFSPGMSEKAIEAAQKRQRYWNARNNFLPYAYAIEAEANRQAYLSATSGYGPGFGINNTVRTGGSDIYNFSYGHSGGFGPGGGYGPFGYSGYAAPVLQNAGVGAFWNAGQAPVQFFGNPTYTHTITAPGGNIMPGAAAPFIHHQQHQLAPSSGHAPNPFGASHTPPPRRGGNQIG